MKPSWIFLLTLLSAVSAGCGTSGTAPEQAARATPANPQVVSAPATILPASTANASGEWLTYNNAQAGYSAKYPPDWTVNESTGTSGELVTTFTGPDGRASIVVSVLAGESAPQQPQDMPNTRCQAVTVSSLPGRRCFDTIASSYSTTVSSKSRLYTIATSVHFVNQDVYQRFLDSFTLAP